MTRTRFERYLDRYGLPVIFLATVILRLLTRDERLAVGSSVVFFYMIWRLIVEGLEATRRLEEGEGFGLRVLQSAEAYAIAQADIAAELRRVTDATTKQVQGEIAQLRAELRENTALTKQASAVAALTHTETAGEMKQALADVQQSIVAASLGPASPSLPSAEHSLHQIEQHTAAIEANTAQTNLNVAKNTADVKDLQKGR